MGVTTEKYIRKPLYVDAVRVTEANFNELAEWCQGELEFEETKDAGPNRKYIRIRVHNPKGPRQTKAFVGDWILYTDRGYKIYTNKAFKAAFDPVVTAPGGGTTVVNVVPVATAPPAVEREVSHVNAASETAPPPTDDSGRRIITIEEQRNLTALEVRELLSTGEAVLEQDLAA